MVLRCGRGRWPGTRTAGRCIGLHDPLGGYSEPDDYLPALAAKCRQLGVEICEGQKVVGVLASGGKVRGVRTADGDLPSDAVVCTTYAWTVRSGNGGTAVAGECSVHQRDVTRPLAHPVPIPAVNANPLSGYFRRQRAIACCWGSKPPSGRSGR